MSTPQDDRKQPRDGARGAETPPREEQRQYLTFLLGGEPYAVGILHVKEILEYPTVTRVPLVPPFIRGVMNLRGSVVPVVDLMARLGRGAGTQTKRTGIVVIEVETENGRQDIGLMVDAVNTVLEIAPGDIEPAPVFGAKIRTDFIRGLAKVNDQFVIIIDVHRVLSIDEMASLLAITGEAAA